MVIDTDNGTHGAKTHCNRSLIEEEDVSKRIPLFSSPQNRRTSSARKYKLRTPSDSNVRDGGRGGSASSVGGGSGVTGQHIGSVPREAVSTVSPGAVGVPVNASTGTPVNANTAGAAGRGTDDASFVSLKATDIPSRGI